MAYTNSDGKSFENYLKGTILDGKSIENYLKGTSSDGKSFENYLKGTNSNGKSFENHLKVTSSNGKSFPLLPPPLDFWRWCLLASSYLRGVNYQSFHSQSWCPLSLLVSHQYFVPRALKNIFCAHFLSMMCHPSYKKINLFRLAKIYFIINFK